MKLYAMPASPNSFKVLAVAYHLGLELEVLDVMAHPELKTELPNYNPNERTPTLVDGDFALWESNAIMQYLAAGVKGQTLWPSERRAQADVCRWQCWQMAHWSQAVRPIFYERILKARLGGGAPDEDIIAAAEKEFHEYAAILEKQLTGRKWLTGDDWTLADIAIGSTLHYSQVARFPLEPYAQVRRWYAQFSEIDAWRKALP